MFQMYHHDKPVAHRSHKKTSTGCKACKVRKVKCDEAKPVCRKCQVHFSNIEKCDYEPSSRRYKRDRAREDSTVQSSDVASSATNDKELDSCGRISPQTISSTSSDEDGAAIRRTEQTLAYRNSQLTKQTKADWRGFQLCKCPCHASQQYADMLSDALFGICRICGNFPSWTTSLEQCCPVVSPKALLESKVDPFGVLPMKSSPRVNSLMYHWVNTMAVFPTSIHSNYCTNPTWLTAAISNAALFNVTLYASSLHLAGLMSKRESTESLYYKASTIRCLNECLKDETQSLSDETIAAVLCLLFVVCVTGEKEEVEAHLRGLRQMINLRGGIHDFTIDGVFLHMLCTTNHVTAVLVETPSLLPSRGPPLCARKDKPECLPLSTPAKLQIRSSEAWRDFGVKIGFHPMVADVLHELSYAYSVVDAFTTRLLPMYRKEFDDICERLEKLYISESSPVRDLEEGSATAIVV